MAQSSPRVYARRKPEQDPLHQVLSQHLLTFLDQAERDPDSAGLPAFVKKELLAYLDCGLLCKGAVRVHCPACDHSLVVALSCRGRGICPSCGGRRMNDTAAHLVDRVLPDVPVRQYVLSLPPKYRFVIARDPARMQAVVGLFVGEVFRWLRRAARARGIKDGRPGAISSLQRFGDGLVYNCHIHGLFLQGVYHRPKIPPPRRHLVGYFGVLSSAAAWRKELHPRPEPEEGQPAPEEPPSVRPRRLGFAALLLRTFGIDLVCPRCEGKMKVVAVVMDEAEVERLCKSLGEATSAPPVQPSRYRRQMQLEFAEPP